MPYFFFDFEHRNHILLSIKNSNMCCVHRVTVLVGINLYRLYNGNAEFDRLEQHIFEDFDVYNEKEETMKNVFSDGAMWQEQSNHWSPVHG